jgi:hypothetical protein
MLTGIARNDALGLSSVITVAHPRKTRWGFGVESHGGSWVRGIRPPLK